MKRFLVLIIFTAALASCTKGGQTARVHLRLATCEVKSVGDTSAISYDAVHFIDIRVYDSHGNLEFSREFASTRELASHPFPITPGDHRFCAYVNCRGDGGRLLMEDERIDCFTMYGELEHTVSGDAYITVPVMRNVARIALKELKVAFSDESLSGASLEDVKVYLVNIPAAVTPEGGAMMDYGRIHDRSRTNNAISPCDLVLDSIGTLADGSIDSWYRHFYSYSHPGTSDTEADKAVYLTVEGSIEGTTYYYPVPVNLGIYGEPIHGTPGVNANNIYEYRLTITRRGSTKPDEPISLSQMNVGIEILPWEGHYLTDILF